MPNDPQMICGYLQGPAQFCCSAEAAAAGRWGLQLTELYVVFLQAQLASREVDYQHLAAELHNSNNNNHYMQELENLRQQVRFPTVAQAKLQPFFKCSFQCALSTPIAACLPNPVPSWCYTFANCRHMAPSLHTAEAQILL